ncbi:glycoside hydrolase family 127 protein [Paenibacillus glycanilyticus]|uniref:beta-L-arabinofuranosidase domain-containing protein n=1 Tax=Paenibacillus glycanilyticus TaxID=126569 RepID=UPI002040DE5B|nr:beta-L-arabinofuranosidase domain-containing protein [Paenibacillus glycanilyticus]MCM3626196.1 glycoside hydrolase family 127 protein [Paenibacillus glycanilyticus]
MLGNFNLDEVKLTDKVFASRRELAKKYLIEFDVDRLMHTFKLNAGIPSNAEPLGGWEDIHCGLRGHFAGHFLSACAKFSNADGDKLLANKAFEIIGMMGLCAQPNGYLSAFEEGKLDILEFEENRNVWAPYYTLHKIMQGLVDGYLYLGSSKSLTLALNLALYIHHRFSKLSYWKIDGILRCTKVNPANEFGGIGDTVYTLYELTGDSRLLELANRFDRTYFVDQLGSGHDVLENLHANTHLPMVIASMHRYSISGEAKYKEMALNFYSFLQGRTFANGNNSSKATAYVKGGVSEKSEHWGGHGKLGDALTGGESESCCAHNTERILERLLGWSGSIEYLDHLETLKYNAILNSASAKTGLSQYHQPMGSRAVKKFSDPYDSFWCCTASGIEAMSELQKNIWFKSEGTIMLNAFISSTVIWREQNVVISQNSEFPDRPISRLDIKAASPTPLKLLLKKKAVKAVKINSVPINLIEDNGYIVIERIFEDCDIIDIHIDAGLSLVPLQGSEGVSAVMYGSILLAMVGQDRLPEGVLESNLLEKLIKLPTEQLEFAVDDDRDSQVRFIPLYGVEEEEYTVYLDWKSEGMPQYSSFSGAKDGSSAYEAESVALNG